MKHKTLDEMLNAKEKRLFYYLADESNSRTIGHICKALHTTPSTLLKTKNSMYQKITEWEKDYAKWCKSIGIEP
jgi:hypothetical protein